MSPLQDLDEEESVLQLCVELVTKTCFLQGALSGRHNSDQDWFSEDLDEEYEGEVQK